MARLMMLGIVVALAGCQSAPAPATPRQAPRYENGGYHRPRNPYFNPKPILALDSAELNRMEAELGAERHRSIAWYDHRNDVRASAVAGQYSPMLEHIATYTHDRQYQHGEHVRDHYQQNTYRSSVKQTVR